MGGSHETQLHTLSGTDGILTGADGRQTRIPRWHLRCSVRYQHTVHDGQQIRLVTGWHPVLVAPRAMGSSGESYAFQGQLNWPSGRIESIDFDCTPQPLEPEHFQLVSDTASTEALIEYFRMMG